MTTSESKSPSCFLDLTGEALIAMPDLEHAEDTLAALTTEQAAEIVGECRTTMRPTSSASSSRSSSRILSAVEPEERRTVERLLEYDEESAGGLMTGAMVTVNEDETVRDALENIRKQAEDVEEFAEVYVLDQNRRPRSWASSSWCWERRTARCGS